MLNKDVHLGNLKKFEALKGAKLIGKEYKKGTTIDRLPPDKVVNEKHILHSLFRGFYKPAQMPYILSCHVTEKIMVNRLFGSINIQLSKKMKEYMVYHQNFIFKK